MQKVKDCAKAVWSLSRPVRWRAGITILVGVFRIAASLSFVWASKYLVDIATGARADEIGPGIWIFLGILIFQLAAVIFSSWWNSYNLVKTQNIIRKDIFGHVLRSRWEGRDRFLSGDTVNRLEEDIRVLSDLICDRIPGLFITGAQLLAAGGYLMVLEPGLLWVLIVLMAAAVFGSRLFFRQIRELMAKIREKESQMQQLMQESLQHRVLVLTLTSAERVLERFGRMQKDVEDNTRTRLNYNAVARGLMFFGFQAGHAAAFIWGITGIMHGTVTFGTMTAFLQLVSQVQRPIAEFGRQIPAFITALTSVERLMELLALEEEDKAAAVMLPGAPEVAVNSVSYSYPGSSQKVLDNFSCTFPGGELSVISGPTGIGKSTLIRIILGLLKPLSGEALIGGRPAGSYLRGNFMYIPQGNSLLSGTIRSNLQLAAPEASEKEMFSALESAMAGFVKELPSGLDTPCGEVGSGLSEGQAQRIAIARALLRPGGVLIMDESTSALDSVTERHLLENLHSLYHGKKTIIFVSHREAVSQFASKVVEL